MAEVLGLDHVSILVKEADKSLQFYQSLLGLTCLKRPDLGFPGYWLDLHAGQTLHLMQLDNPYMDAVRPEHGGRDVHFALRVDGLDGFIEKLKLMSTHYTLSQSGRKAVFIQDLDQNAFELFEITT